MSDFDFLSSGLGDGAGGEVVSPLRWSPTGPGGSTMDQPLSASGDLPLRTVQFGCHFLLDVVLHCRERAGKSLPNFES